MNIIRKMLAGSRKVWVVTAGALVLFGLYFLLAYIRTNGFSGLSPALPLFLAGGAVSGLLSTACFSAWVYEDSDMRGEDAGLWAFIVFAATPFIGLLIYFLRRQDIKRACVSCGSKISVRANYCENCGEQVEKKEELIMQKTTHHIYYIVIGAAAMLLLLISLVGFIITAAVSGNVNSNVSSGSRVWNRGAITMSVETNFNGVWKLKFKKASDGFIKETKMKIEDHTTQYLSADIKCGNVPEGASLTLWLVQGETAQSYDVTSLDAPLEIPLDGFENGRMFVRLEINGVTNVESYISIMD